jgi:hypothetical protein
MQVYVVVGNGVVLAVYDNEKAADEHADSLKNDLQVRVYSAGVRSR